MAIESNFLVQGKVVVELKALDQVAPVHEVQLVSYLRLTGCRVGLLVNFHAPTLKRSIVRRAL